MEQLNREEKLGKRRLRRLAKKIDEMAGEEGRQGGVEGA